jgi:hypothetical protein
VGVTDDGGLVWGVAFLAIDNEDVLVHAGR